MIDAAKIDEACSLGVPREVAKHALELYNWDVNRAVNAYYDGQFDDFKPGDAVAPPAGSTPDTRVTPNPGMSNAIVVHGDHVASGSGVSTHVGSLESNDIEKAIKLSLEFEKKKKRQDKTSILDLQLDDQTLPRGLKNLGNTCFVNCLMQLYFYLTPVRDKILRLEDSKNKLITHLQELFANLLYSEQRYFNPKLLLDFMADDKILEQVGVQEDINEVNEKLLTRLEEADESLSEYLKSIFYGSFVTTMESKEEDDTKIERKNKEPFNHLHINISNELTSLYQSLDALTSSETIEFTTDKGFKTTAERITFVQKPPPVILFQLKRSLFNREVGMALKINEAYSFPDVLYFDRYMDKNKEEILKRRETVKKHKDEIRLLRDQLKRFMYTGKDGPSLLHDTLAFLMQIKRGEGEVRNGLEKIHIELKEHVTNLNLRVKDHEMKIDTIFDDMGRNEKYVLYGIVVHEGTTVNMGHYTTFIKYNLAQDEDEDEEEVEGEGEEGEGEEVKKKEKEEEEKKNVPIEEEEEEKKNVPIEEDESDDDKEEEIVDNVDVDSDEELGDVDEKKPKKKEEDEDEDEDEEEEEDDDEKKKKKEEEEEKEEEDEKKDDDEEEKKKDEQQDKKKKKKKGGNIFSSLFKKKKKKKAEDEDEDNKEEEEEEEEKKKETETSKEEKETEEDKMKKYKWCKFNDTNVTLMDEASVYENLKIGNRSAYCLLYLHKDFQKTILPPNKPFTLVTEPGKKKKKKKKKGGIEEPEEPKTPITSPVHLASPFDFGINEKLRERILEENIDFRKRVELFLENEKKEIEAEKLKFGETFHESRGKLGRIFRTEMSNHLTIPREIMSCKTDRKVTNLPLFYAMLLGSVEHEVVDFELAKIVYDEVIERKKVTSFDMVLNMINVRRPDERNLSNLRKVREQFMRVTRYIAKALSFLNREDYNLQLAIISLRHALAIDNELENEYIRSFPIIVEYLVVCMSLLYEMGIQLLKSSRRQCIEYFTSFRDYASLVIRSDLFKDHLRNQVSKFFEACYYIEDSHKFDENDCKFVNEKVINIFQALSTPKKSKMKNLVETTSRINWPISIGEYLSMTNKALGIHMKKTKEQVNKKHYNRVHNFRYPRDTRNRGYYVNKRISDNGYKPFTNFFKPRRTYRSQHDSFFAWN